VQGTKENHCDHAGEKNDDDGRIDEAEPVDSRVEDMEIFIPSSSPSRSRILKVSPGSERAAVGKEPGEGREAGGGSTFHSTLYV